MNSERDDLSKPNLLPYGIVPQAPAIIVPNVDLFKKNKSQSVVHYFDAKVAEIKKLYEEFLTEVHINDIIYSAKHSFVPIIGKVYFLYKTDVGYMLSLIEPERWNKFPYVGAYKLTSNDIWEVVE